MLKYKKRSRLFGKSGISTTVLIVLELFAIIGGVMLGFAMNDWRENRNNQKVAEIALESIAAEFRYNHQRMHETYDYFRFIVEKIDSLHHAGESVREMYGYEIEGWRGAMPPMLRSSAYQMVLSTGIFKDIEFKTANTLAYIYNLQSILEKLDDASVVNFSQDSGFTSLPNIRHTFNLYTEIIPSVIGVYQLIGVPVLNEYGYDMSLQEGKLKQASVEQMQGFDMQDF